MLTDDNLQRLFTEARTHKAWVESTLSPDTLRRLYDLVRWGPTSNNSAPARFGFAMSAEGKAAVLDALHEGNRLKVEGAAVLTVVSHDTKHWRHWQRLSPHKDLAAIYAGKPEASREESYRNALIQCGYLVMAARALGLDAFPMTGFHRDRMDTTALVPAGAHSVLVCALGTGDPSRLRKRAARLEFDEACLIV